MMKLVHEITKDFVICARHSVLSGPTIGQVCSTNMLTVTVHQVLVGKALEKWSIVRQKQQS